MCKTLDLIPDTIISKSTNRWIKMHAHRELSSKALNDWKSYNQVHTWHSKFIQRRGLARPFLGDNVFAFAYWNWFLGVPFVTPRRKQMYLCPNHTWKGKTKCSLKRKSTPMSVPSLGPVGDSATLKDAAQGDVFNGVPRKGWRMSRPNMRRQVHI